MFGYLQKIGRSLMIPVAVLPAAAILMGLGYWIDPNGWGSNSVLAALLIKSGAAIIDQMPILFAVGVAFGMSKDKNGSAALTGLVGFLVVTTLLSPGCVALLTGLIPPTFDLLAYLKGIDPALFPAGVSLADAVSIDLSQVPVIWDSVANNHVYDIAGYLQGIDLSSVPAGVNLSSVPIGTNLASMVYDAVAVPAAFGKINNQFIGILVGVIAAELYNRFSAVQLHKALSFFSGRRLVPIIMSFVMILVSFILLYIWPFIFNGLVNFGTSVQGLGSLGAGIFGFANRLLIPFGLHHALNSVFWFDVAKINDIPNFLAGNSGAGIAGVTGMYQAGFFPVMMFGLIGAACAFVKTAKPQNKEKVKSIMIAAGFASFFTGVTEPLEFAFMFLAPPLYLLHALFTGISLTLAAKMQWMSGFGFSAGLVDFILSAKNPLAVKWYMLILQGLFFFVLYYFSFTFIITKFKLKTPGREDEEKDDILMVSAPSLEIVEQLLPLLGGKDNIVSIDNCVTRLRLVVKDSSLTQEVEINKHVPGILVVDETTLQVIIGMQAEHVAEAFRYVVEGKAFATPVAAPGSHAELAAAILTLLGGKDNIVGIDNCITRMRLDVKDSSVVKVEELKKITSGVLVPGKTAVQVIIGTEVEFVTEEFRKLV